MYAFRLHKVGVSLLCLLLIFSATYALGQGIVTGSISGTVVDQQGAVIVGAKVIVRSTATNQEFTDISSGTGAFSLRLLPPGNYIVTISAPNFQTLELKDVLVKVGVDTALGAKTLPVGPATESVIVETAPPLVETTTPQLSTTYESKQITDLPIPGAFDQLALLVPGAARGGDANFSNTNGAAVSMNGQRDRSNNFQIDGQNSNDNSVAGPAIFLSNQDVLAEYQVVSNNFSAEYGRNMGSVVNYITKSGTNSFHGTGFWFYQGSWTSSLANDEKSPLFGYCLRGQTNANTGGACQDPNVPRFDDNRPGGTIGGPIKKDKLWFFGSYQREWFRQGSSPSASTTITPTPAGLAQLNACYPTAPALVALNQFGPYAIPAGGPTPTGAVTLQSFAANAFGGPCANVPFSPVTRFLPSTFNDNQITGRIDWQVTSKDRFFGRYIFQSQNNTNATGRFAAGMVVNVPARDQQIGLDWVHTFTDHFLNQVRFSYARMGVFFHGGTFEDCLNTDINVCPSNQQFNDGTTLTFGMQTNLPQSRLVNNSQWQDNASWVHGRHTFKMGGEYQRQRSPNVFLPNTNGSFIWADFQSFLNNTTTQFRLTNGASTQEYKEQDIAAYFQDSFRFRDNLTFTFGIRWEWNQQAINMLHDLTVARETGPAPFWDTTLPLSRRTVPPVNQDYHNFGPVVGFAYTPRFWESVFGKDRTVIRGGFRIAYDPAFYNLFLNTATGAPVVNAGVLTSGVGVPVGFPATGEGLRAANYLLLIPTGVDPGTRAQTLVPSDFHNPYSEQWNLGVQRQITDKIAVEVNYVGNHTVGNFQTVNANPFLGPIGGAPSTGLINAFPGLVPAGVTQCATAGQPGFNTRPLCDKSLLTMRVNGGWSIYHGLQTSIRFQNWHGFTSGLNWTWSHGIDNVSEAFTLGDGDPTSAIAQNPFDADRGERGTSWTSYTHVFTMWFNYELPFYKSQQGLLGHVLGGWELNSVYSYNTGQPVQLIQLGGSASLSSVYCDRTFNATYDACRPILNDPTAPIQAVGRYNPGCTLYDPNGTGFTSFRWVYNNTQAALCLGNPFAGVGRNTITGETYNNVNLGVYKNFKMGERLTMQLQANASNVLNRQFRGTPDNILNDRPFEYFQATGVPGSFMNTFFNGSNNRNMTFGVKFIF